MTNKGLGILTKSLFNVCSFKHNLVCNSIFENKKSKEEEALLLTKYQKWLSLIKDNIHKSKYRSALKIISKMPSDFDKIYCRFDLEALKMRCILKIINKTIRKYELYIKDEESIKRRSIEFWFNQMYIIFHHLLLEIRVELNPSAVISKDVRHNQIEEVVMLILDGLYYLNLFGAIIDDVPSMGAYIAMKNSLEKFIQYSQHPKTLQNYQKITFLSLGLYIKNLDYINAFKEIEAIMALSYRQFFLLLDYDEEINLDIVMKKCENLEGKLLLKCLLMMVFAFYQKAALYETLGNLSRALKSYKQAVWISNRFLKISYPEINEFITQLYQRADCYYNIICHIDKCIIAKQKKFKKAIEEKKRSNTIRETRPRTAIKPSIGKTYDIRKKIEYRRMEKTTDFLSKLDLHENLMEKTQYPRKDIIISTVHLLDCLQSNQFRSTVKDMKSMNISSLDSDDVIRIRKRLNNTPNAASLHIQHKLIKSRSSFDYSVRCIDKTQCRSTRHMHSSYQSKPFTVEKLHLDKYLFNPEYQEKKAFLDQYREKEFKFQKSLILTKRIEVPTELSFSSKEDMKKKSEMFFRAKLSVLKERDSQDILKGIKSAMIKKEQEQILINQVSNSLTTKSCRNLQLYRKQMKKIKNTTELGLSNIYKSLSDRKVVLRNNQTFIKKFEQECLENDLSPQKEKKRIKRISSYCQL